MKATCYLRIAKTSRGLTYSATTKPSATPLYSPRGEAYPTVAVKLVLDLPPGTFDAILATLTADVPEHKLQPIGMDVADAAS